MAWSIEYYDDTSQKIPKRELETAKRRLREVKA